MVTVLVELEDEVFARLQEKATAAETSVAELLARVVQTELSAPVSAERFHLMDQLIERYRPVFHRLAQ